MWCKYAGLRADLNFFSFLFSQKNIKSKAILAMDRTLEHLHVLNHLGALQEFQFFSFLKIITWKQWRKHPYDGLMTFISFDTGLKHKVFFNNAKGEKEKMKRDEGEILCFFLFFFLFFPIVPAKTLTKSEFSYFLKFSF